MPITSGSVVIIRVITPRTPISGEVMGFCNQFSTSKVISSEIFVPLGSHRGVESVYHGETGQFSWGEAHTMSDFTARGLVADTTAFDSFVAYTIRVLRRTDGSVVAHLLGALPNSADIAVSSLATLNANISGVCQVVRHGSEFNPPGSQ